MGNKFIAIVALAFLSTVAYAQKGFIRGNVSDGDFGGPLIGTTIVLADNPGVGTISDFDGNYSLALEPGTYTVQMSFVSYQTQLFKDVVVKAGEATIIDAILASAAEELATFEVTAEVRRNSETAILMDMKKASVVMDGISAQSFRKVGDSDLSGAIKRVTGVTVQNGKYVYVRGLGDRYTKTTLNGMILPSLDPDVNAVQIDIFPTSILENVAVYKSFTPNLYGDFTGGLVDVVTKNFPDEKTTQVGVGLTAIGGQTFNKDFILYDRGKFDWLGFDDGSRALQFNPRIYPYNNVPDEALVDPLLEEMTRSFNPQLSAKSKVALPNGSFSFNRGNQINKENGKTYGYNFVVNYSNETSFYEGFQSNDYLKDTDYDVNSLYRRVVRTSNVGKNNVNWSALLTGSVKRNNNSVTATLLHSQNAETTAAQRVNQDFNQNQSTLLEDVLTYTQRQLTYFLLNGKHKKGSNQFNWGLSGSYSRVYDPDFRETRISITDGDTTLSTGNGSGIDRFWRDLNEFGTTLKGDYIKTFSKNFELSTGLVANLRYRDFENYAYKVRRNDLNNISIDPDWYMLPENIWSSNPESDTYRNGTYVLGNFQRSNQYESFMTTAGAYVSAKQTVLGLINLIYGVRVEKADAFYTGRTRDNQTIYNNTRTLNELNVLPSLNVVYPLTQDMNLRFAANRTIARPTFKEKSIAEIYDPITKRTFIGNIDLNQTKVNNLDFRYEYFLSPKELISVAAFYKQFDGHIELVSFPTSPQNIQPRNSGIANLLGVEFEVRKSLSSGSTGFLSKLFLGGNATFVHSAVDLNSVVVDNISQMTEYELRSANLRTGETLAATRQMAGQSPYTLNGNINYEIPEKQFNLAIAYNVQGDQLSVIASGRVPDVYTKAFHSLDINAYKGFGKDFKHRISVKVGNVLNDDRLLVYKSYGAEEEIYTVFKPGVNFGVKYNYTF